VSGNGRAGATPEAPFGQRLRALREGAGLTQEELADALRLSEEDRLSLLASVQKRGEPSPAALGPALPVPPTSLLGRGWKLGAAWKARGAGCSP
jgi:transcriptional regulator with XRE-family HTH domain